MPSVSPRSKPLPRASAPCHSAVPPGIRLAWLVFPAAVTACGVHMAAKAAWWASLGGCGSRSRGETGGRGRTLCLGIITRSLTKKPSGFPVLCPPANCLFLGSTDRHASSLGLLTSPRMRLPASGFDSFSQRSAGSGRVPCGECSLQLPGKAAQVTVLTMSGSLFAFFLF